KPPPIKSFPSTTAGVARTWLPGIVTLQPFRLPSFVVNGCGAAILDTGPACCARPPGLANGELGAFWSCAGICFALAGFVPWASVQPAASHASPTNVHNIDRFHTLHDMAHLLFR